MKQAYIRECIIPHVPQRLNLFCKYVIRKTNFNIFPQVLYVSNRPLPAGPLACVLMSQLLAYTSQEENVGTAQSNFRLSHLPIVDIKLRTVSVPNTELKKRGNKGLHAGSVSTMASIRMGVSKFSYGKSMFAKHLPMHDTENVLGCISDTEKILGRQ
jgi:hypothetical protein